MVHAPAKKKSNGTTNTNNNTTKQFEMELEEPQQPIPPDGGWGWMVVFGSFMIHIITDGMTYSFGLFYDEFLVYFNEGKGYTAWIVSIMVGVTFASGPISSAFVNRYGCRAVTIAGSILTAVCIVISTLAQNVLTLIITIGLGTGLGLGLIYLPAIVSVSTYFEAKRSLATGIAVCGSGFGTFVFAPLMEQLMGSYGWRGALLIVGGIVLNCIIFGAMFRPLEPPKPASTKKAIIDNHTTSAELEPLKPNIKQADQYLQLPKSETNGLSRSNSVGHTFKNKVNNSNGSSNGKLDISVVSKSNSHDDMIRPSLSQPHLGQMQRELQRELHREKSGSGTMYRPDILYQGSLHNIPEYVRSRQDLTGSGAIQRYGSVRHSQLHLSQEEEIVRCCGITCSRETRDTMREMMNFGLLSDVIFVIFAISNFCTSIGFNMPYVYIVSQAKALQLTGEQSSYLISTIGVANTIGRIILGYISDKPWVNRLWVYNVCLTICGIATAMCPLCTGFNSLAFYCSVFGFTIGAYVGLTSVILVDLLGLEKLTNAFGILLLFQGVASLIGPPIGGWMYDITLSYSPAFILAGVMIAISGLIMFVVPPLQRRIARKEMELNAHDIALS
ncbi:monocarboxylate transporter 12 [Stomoxys calcitrans]|uniref:monocarboxylate transporter 12 n=1 Tax=Stomoxys calcitrans TaxID=35570 RepID=UPI0027E24624|nr:monocarboxylate transporter 12 [Stomoxys calcitrans]